MLQSSKFIITLLFIAVCAFNQLYAQDQEKKNEIHVGLNAGYAFTTLKTESSPLFFHWLRDQYKYNNPTYGAEVVFSSKSNYTKIAMVTGFQVYYGDFSDHTESSDQTSESEHDITVDMHSLVIPFALRFYFNEEGARPYLQFGLQNNFNINSNTTRYTIHRGATFGTEEEEGVAWTFGASQFGILAETGIIIPIDSWQLGLGMRYSTTSNFVTERSVIKEASIKRLDFRITVATRVFKSY